MQAGLEEWEVMAGLLAPHPLCGVRLVAWELEALVVEGGMKGGRGPAQFEQRLRRGLLLGRVLGLLWAVMVRWLGVLLVCLGK